MGVEPSERGKPSAPAGARPPGFRGEFRFESNTMYIIRHNLQGGAADTVVR
jgi:hypothetical protein